MQKMREACKLFIGEHDFRNFCKMDAANVDNFVRVVLSFSIDPVPGLQRYLYLLRSLGSYVFGSIVVRIHTFRCTK